jgi:hypothetical protein
VCGGGLISLESGEDTFTLVFVVDEMKGPVITFNDEEKAESAFFFLSFLP